MITNPEGAPSDVSMAEIAGLPAAAFYLQSGQVWYVQATDDSGASWEEPQCVWGKTGALGISLASWNNRPAISFGTGSGGAIYFSFLP